MAEFATITRPYAKALFDLAQEKKQIESWLDKLKGLSAVVRQEKVISLIKQPGTDTSGKARLLTDLVGLKDDSLKNFVTVLAEQKRLPILPEVYVQYQDLTLTPNNTKSAVIYSVYELTSIQAAELAEMLKKRFNTELIVTTQVNPKLIGGIRVEVGGQVLDLPIRGKSNALYTTMTNQESLHTA